MILTTFVIGEKPELDEYLGCQSTSTIIIRALGSIFNTVEYTIDPTFICVLSPQGAYSFSAKDKAVIFSLEAEEERFAHGLLPNNVLDELFNFFKELILSKMTDKEVFDMRVVLKYQVGKEIRKVGQITKG